MLSKHRGVALIMVLLAMALVVMLASGMLRQQNLRVFKAVITWLSNRVTVLRWVRRSLPAAY